MRDVSHDLHTMAWIVLRVLDLSSHKEQSPVRVRHAM
jgi:hypothetical protein